jgi:GNAT superfamily N-acetyltransferase
VSQIKFLEREMTPAEYAREQAGFDEHAAEFGNPPYTAERYTLVVVEGDRFIGCASGLNNDNGSWFYLTDLFVEKPYRRKGLGAETLARMERKAASLGFQHIWTWTAGYEAPSFYKKQGYEVFSEFKNWYPSGHSRVGLWKDL